jgi:hypothetical protein
VVQFDPEHDLRDAEDQAVQAEQQGQDDRADGGTDSEAGIDLNMTGSFRFPG